MIVIGTSGYHFTDWTGVFYPDGLPKDKWLSYYAGRFPCVEINMTYYGLPRLETVARWSEQTPDSFAFFVKLHRESTHLREREGRETAELLEVLAPLRSARKLRGLLAQFPASFHAGEKGYNYLAALGEKVGEYNLFVELRHRSWDSGKTVDFLRDHGLGWVVVDQPNLPGLAGPRPAVTGNTGYVRFHGRNAKTWYNPELGDRYDWMYSEEELRGWIPRIRAMDQRAEMTYLFFNNCHAGQAVRSAMKLKKLLEDQFEVFK